jgi:hypothetical protein
VGAEVMSFKDRSWEQRFGAMGDEAEGHFEAYAKEVLNLGFVRFGLNRPPIALHTVPARLRYMPDYLMSKRLVEVQGVGRDQLIKLKLDKWGVLHHWNDVRTAEFDGVWIYIWDSHHKRECMFPLANFDKILGEGHGALGHFPEGKPYFEFDADLVFMYADA